MRARIALLWLLWLIVVSVQSVKTTGKMPEPSRFVSGTVLYSIAGVVSEFEPTFGFGIALAWTIGVGYKLLEQSNAPATIAKGEKSPPATGPKGGKGGTRRRELAGAGAGANRKGRK